MTWGIDDYPYRGRCPGACSAQCAGQCGGSWACCQCASFACWRIANDLGVHLGSGYGNANTWVAAARANGIPTDHTPTAGSIVCLPNISSAGHVGFVLAVGPTTAFGHTVPAGQVLVEDYNWDFCCCHQVHTLAVASSGAAATFFLHVGGTGPPPPPPCAQGCPPCTVCVDNVCASTCTAGTVCDGATCICPAGTTWDGSACTVPAPAGADAGALVLLLGAAVVGAYELHHRGNTLAGLLHQPPGSSGFVDPQRRLAAGRVARAAQRRAPSGFTE